MRGQGFACLFRISARADEMELSDACGAERGLLVRLSFGLGSLASGQASASRNQPSTQRKQDRPCNDY